MTTTTTDLNLRPSAGTGNTPLLTIPSGAAVTVIGASGGNATVTSDAAAKARNAKVRIDDIGYHQNPIVGIYRPDYP